MSGQSLIKEKGIKFEIDGSELRPNQVRLAKAFVSALSELMTTEDEEQYFEGSADFMRLCASIIEQSNFPEKMKQKNTIQYSQQSLEYAIDILNEFIAQSKVVNYDN